MIGSRGRPTWLLAAALVAGGCTGQDTDQAAAAPDAAVDCARSTHSGFPCGAEQFAYSDTLCSGPPFDPGYTCEQCRGAGRCYDHCDADGTCPDPCFPVCVQVGRCGGNDYCAPSQDRFCVGEHETVGCGQMIIVHRPDAGAGD